MSFTIGADPELFLMKDGEYLSVEDYKGPLIPGTKARPFEVKGGAIQVDGVAAEFNLNPAKEFKTYYQNLKDVLGELRNRVKSKDASLKLVANPTATFNKFYFDHLPEHTKELGCDPDYNAYTMEPNPRPRTNKPFRTGSGHIHIGFTSKADVTSQGHMLDCALVTKQLDKALLFAAKDWDNDVQRMELYGKPGAFRAKPYGVEYRPVSNAWLRGFKSVKGVFDITLSVMRAIDSGKHDLDIDYSKSYGDTNSEKVMNALGEFNYDLY